MEERYSDIRGSAGGNVEVVRVDDIKVGNRRMDVIPFPPPDKVHTNKNAKHKTKFKCIRFDKKRRIWEAVIKINGKKIYLGSRKKDSDAALLYDRYVITNNIRFKSGNIRATNYDLYGEYWK